MHHYLLPESLPTLGIDTKVWWALNPAGKALVFVHGFGGKALQTWTSFPALLTSDPRLAGWDLIFFGYDGKHTEMVSSATDLERLFDTLETSPSHLYKQSTAYPGLPRQSPTSYERVIVAAHSLGAVVSRRALIDGHRRGTGWAKKVELVLFAPAHHGAKIFRLAVEAFGFAAPLVALPQFMRRYVVLSDLKVGSQALQDLHADLKGDYLAHAGTRSNLQATKVVWAYNDPIVVNATLTPDQPIDPQANLRNVSHTTVCKPHVGDRRPYNLLISLI